MPGTFYKLCKALFKDYQKQKKTIAPHPKISINIKKIENTNHGVNGLIAPDPNTRDDFNLLLAIHKKYLGEQNPEFVVFVKKINAEADPHKCPYCNTRFEFTASRARKCPNCGEKMVVRQGLFLTEKQATEVEDLWQQHYSRQELLTRLGDALQSAQNNKIQKQVMNYYRQLAEAFRYAAQIENAKDEKGFSFWDKAWGHYNHARELAMAKLQGDDFDQYNQLPEISWDMTQMLADQASKEKNEERKQKMERRALEQACMTLAEATKLGAEPYYLDQVYTLSKNIITGLRITKEELENITERLSQVFHLSGSTTNTYKEKIREMFEYEIIDRGY